MLVTVMSILGLNGMIWSRRGRAKDVSGASSIPQSLSISEALNDVYIDKYRQHKAESLTVIWVVQVERRLCSPFR